ncbi:MAG: hypothetical protein J6V72_10200 [Kiritimatiellae bacterium]|nr:hypothetical protein [Kiritimatiellia bacterium]
MDVVSIGAALALAKKQVLPQTTAADAGDVLAVGPDGTWTKAESANATITVSGTTLTITGGDDT